MDFSSFAQKIAGFIDPHKQVERIKSTFLIRSFSNPKMSRA